MKKILIIPARRHILEAYSEYIIRYLSDEFYFEMGYPPMPPYDNIRERVWTGETSPLEKNPDEFDLIYPHFTTHFFLEPTQKYLHKIALVVLEPGSWSSSVAIMAGTSAPVEKGFGDNPYHSLRFGVDTELFAPYPMVRTDNLFHVGFLGNVMTPRRYIKELYMDALKDLLGIRLMIFPSIWHKHTRPDEIVRMGGQAFIDAVVDGDKWYPGLPNIYNQMDVYIRCDIDHGEQLSVMEAAACGVPVVCTDSGNSKLLCDAGGGICIDCGDRSWKPENLSRMANDIQKAVVYLQNHPEERRLMGQKARKFVENNWTWKHHIDNWRAFFREGVKNATV